MFHCSTCSQGTEVAEARNPRPVAVRPNNRATLPGLLERGSKWMFDAAARAARKATSRVAGLRSVIVRLSATVVASGGTVHRIEAVRYRHKRQVPKHDVDQ